MKEFASEEKTQEELFFAYRQGGCRVNIWKAENYVWLPKKGHRY